MSVRKFNVMDLGKAGLLDPTKMGYMDSIEIIKDESFKVQKSFVKIGWYLKHIRDHELYKEGGYANVYECTADQLGYSQSTASRFINICEKFSKDHNSPELDEKYAGFDKSQMIEMLPMEPELLEKVTPDMTVAKIRSVKNEKASDNTKKVKEKIEDGISGQTSIEKDFPEYLLETNISKISSSEKEEDATSHENNEINAQNKDLVESERGDGEEIIIDGTYREIEKDTKPEIQRQAELPLLNNNEQRKEWLKKYKEWGLWYYDVNIDVNYYKFDFADGSRLVVAEYPNRLEYWNSGNTLKDEYFYHLLEKNKKGHEKTFDEVYRHSPYCETYLVEFLKNLQNTKK